MKNKTRKVSRSKRRTQKNKKIRGGSYLNSLYKSVEPELKEKKPAPKESFTAFNYLANSAISLTASKCESAVFRYRKIINILKESLYDYIDSLGRSFTLMSPQSILKGALIYIRKIPRLSRYSSFIKIDESYNGKMMQLIVEMWIREIQDEVKFQVLKGNKEMVHDLIDLYIDKKISTVCSGENPENTIIRKCSWGGELYKSPRCPGYDPYKAY